jgi:hypothetical protein
MIKKQFTLYLENRPGALAKVTRVLASAKVNIEGISVSSSVDIGLVQIVVSNAQLTKQLLTRARIPFVTQDVVLLELPNKPGALARVVAEIARMGLNINYVYATACDGDAECRCFTIISAPNLKEVEAACKAAL